MDKLLELQQKAKEAEHAFIYAKDGVKLAPLYEAQQKAYKELADYKVWLYKGSGVNGNEI